MLRLFKSKSAARRAASRPAIAAAAMIETLEVRSLFTAAPAAAPIIATTPTPQVYQGEIVQADFSAGPAVTAWTIDWGDGAHNHFDSERSHATHIYTAAGTFAARLIANVPGPDPTPATLTYDIQNVAPDVAITAAPAEGQQGTAISVGSIVNDDSPLSSRQYGWTVYRDGVHYIVPDATDIASGQFTFTPADSGTYVIRLTVLDGQGGVTTVQTAAIAVANVAPTGAIGGVPTSTVIDGSPVTLTANATDAGTDNLLTYAWSLSVDGTPVDLADATTRQQTLAALADGVYTAGCIVTDGDGAATVLTPVTFEVRTPLPTTSVSIGGLPPTSDEGTAVNAYATVFGPEAGDAQNFAWSVTKDGRPYALPSDVDVASEPFMFTPDDNGEYVVSLTVTSATATIGQASQAVTVANVAPTLTLTGEPISPVAVGDSVHLTTTLTDPGTADGHWYEWSIAKDGQPWTPAIDTRLDGQGLMFVPTESGTFVVTATVHDLDGGEGSVDSLPIDVA